MNLELLRQAYIDGDTNRISALLSEGHSLSGNEPHVCSVSPLQVICRLLVNQDDIALREFQSLDINDYLTSPQDLSDFGLCQYLLGFGDQALDTLLSAELLSSASDPINKARLASVFLAAGNPSRAESYMLSAIAKLPRRYEWLSNMGRIYHVQSRYSDALHFYDQALELNPSSESVNNLRSQALISAGQAGYLITELESRLKEDISHRVGHAIQLSSLYESLGHFHAAEKVLAKVYGTTPSDDVITEAYVSYLIRRESYRKAGELIVLHQTLYPKSYYLDEYRLRCEIEVGLLDQANRTLLDLKKRGLSHTVYHLESLLLSKQELYQDATKLLEEGIANFPGSRLIRYELGHLYLLLGDTEKANALDSEQAHCFDGFFLRYMQDVNSLPNPEQLDRLKHLASDNNPDSNQRALACFTYAVVLEKQKEYTPSFEMATKANNIVKGSTGYSWRSFRRSCIQLTDYFTPEKLLMLKSRIRSYEPLDSIPIFVLGMPRSGTSLTEQILASHPDIEGKGELGWITRITMLAPNTCGMKGKKLFPACLDNFDRRHFQSARNYYIEKAKASSLDRFFIDKMPHNFMYVPLLSLLFPESPIICLDRDPFDVAISCYYQNFSSFSGVMGFSYDLTWIGKMLQDFDYLMSTWQALPISNLYRLSYEALVSDPQKALNPILSCVNLEWSDNMYNFQSNRHAVQTASIRQVRQPLYKTSLKKWKRYEAHISELIESYNAPYSI